MKHISVAKRVLKLESEALDSMVDLIDDNFAKVVDEMLFCKGKIVLSGMGKSGHIAAKIASTLISTGTQSIFVHPAEASHGDLGIITKDDIALLLSNSGETSELSDIVFYCKREGIKIISITKCANSTLAKASYLTLPLPDVSEACSLGLAPTTSTTATLALGDALAVSLLEARDFKAVDFKKFHPGGKLGSKLLEVNQIMTSKSEVPIVKIGTAFSNALSVMEQHRLGCVAIVNEDKLVGVFTDGDLLRKLKSTLNPNSKQSPQGDFEGSNILNANFEDLKIDDLMTKSPKTVPSNMRASSALELMEQNKISVIFVCDDGRLKGIVHMHDLLRSVV